MSFRKYASLEVLEAWRVPARAGADGIRKAAHRVTFDYTPRPGYLYVRSRAISSRTNDNHDTFPAEEIEKAYKTFLGKPAFVNHRNSNHRRARGVIVAVALHKDRNPDSSPDTWAECLHEIDAVRFPKLARAILSGRVNRTSMGVDCEHSTCSACGNRATSPAEYCTHMPSKKGMKIRQRGEDGKIHEKLVHEICAGLTFFENSFLVEDPADPTAHILDKPDARGLSMAASRKVTAEQPEHPLMAQLRHLREAHGLDTDISLMGTQLMAREHGIELTPPPDDLPEDATQAQRIEHSSKSLSAFANSYKALQYFHKRQHQESYQNQAGVMPHSHGFQDPLTTLKHHPDENLYPDHEPESRIVNPNWWRSGDQGLMSHQKNTEWSRRLHPERTDEHPNVWEHQDPNDPDTWTNGSACSRVYPHAHSTDEEGNENRETCPECGALTWLHARFLPSEAGRPNEAYREEAREHWREQTRGKTGPFRPLPPHMSSRGQGALWDGASCPRCGSTDLHPPRFLDPAQVHEFSDASSGDVAECSTCGRQFDTTERGDRRRAAGEAFVRRRQDRVQGRQPGPMRRFDPGEPPRGARLSMRRRAELSDEEIWRGLNMPAHPERDVSDQANTTLELHHRFGENGGDYGVDQNGDSYYQVNHRLPNGQRSGWYARNYGGPLITMHHVATGPDVAHEAITLPSDNVNGYLVPGYGHMEMHNDLHRWHNEDGGTRDYLENDQYGDKRIQRWRRQRSGSRRTAAGRHDYRMQHQAPDKNSGRPYHRYHGIDPDELVTVYRSVPPRVTTIHHGDWVSTDPAYAHQHGRHNWDPSKDWPVLQADVPARHLYWDENDENEIGYQGPHLGQRDVSYHEEDPDDAPPAQEEYDRWLRRRSHSHYASRRRAAFEEHPANCVNCGVRLESREEGSTNYGNMPSKFPFLCRDCGGETPGAIGIQEYGKRPLTPENEDYGGADMNDEMPEHALRHTFGPAHFLPHSLSSLRREAGEPPQFPEAAHCINCGTRLAASYEDGDDPGDWRMGNMPFLCRDCYTGDNVPGHKPQPVTPRDKGGRGSKGQSQRWMRKTRSGDIQPFGPRNSLPYSESALLRRIAADPPLRVPSPVDTLRPDTCPVCGDSDVFKGQRCPVCGFVAPPDIFRDPDIDGARMRHQQLEDGKVPLGMPEGPADEEQIGSGMDADDQLLHPDQIAPDGVPGVQPDGEGNEQGMLGGAPGEEQLQDPAALDENGQPVLDENGEPLDPQALGEDGAVPPEDEEQAGEEEVQQGAAMSQGGEEQVQQGQQEMAEGEERQEGAAAEAEAEEEEADEDASPGKGQDEDRPGGKRKMAGQERTAATVALAAQQRVITAQAAHIRVLEAQMRFLADMAGVTPQMDQIRRKADLGNPASPVPDPAQAPAPESTEQALMPETMGDPSRPGTEPGSVTHVPAAQTTTAITPGVEMQTAPATMLTDVTAPIQGTNPSQDGGVPLEQRRILTDVRVNPNPLAAQGPGIGGLGNDGTAYPWVIAAREKAGMTATASRQQPVTAEDERGARTFASIRLARLQVTAGLARGDELEVGAAIERDASLSLHDIEREIGTLEKVSRRDAAIAPQRGRPVRTAARYAPSLAAPPAPAFAMTAAYGPGDDLDGGDIFLD